MLNIDSGRRDLFIALAGRVVSTLGDEVALAALTLRLQAGAAARITAALMTVSIRA